MMCFCSWTFAQSPVEAAAETEKLYTVAWLLNYLVSFLAWWRVLLAKLAWTFLTNRRVLGEAIWLDSLLRKYWNVMKNLANFWLWFYLIFAICKWLVSSWKWSILTNIKNIILWIFIAWLWIQLSWFFTVAVIDVSTITLAAAWSFPSQVVAEDSQKEKAILKSIEKFAVLNGGNVEEGSEITLYPVDSAATSYLKTMNVELEDSVNSKQLFDKIMPSADDVAWPLYFMWYSILNTQWLTSVNSSDGQWLKATILNTILQWWTTIVYSIEMLVLCVLAIMRIIYLWMFIILSPFAILLWCIEKSWQKISWWKDKWFLSGFTKQINLTSFFLNVFKPTIIVLWLWIALLVTSLMGGLIGKDAEENQNFDIWWVTVTSTKDPTSNSSVVDEWDKTYTTTMDLWVLRFTLAHAWKTFLEIIISIITVLIVYLIIKLAVQMWNGKDFVSEKIGKLQDSIQNAMTSVPIIPVTAYDKEWAKKTAWLSAGTVFGIGNKDSLADQWLHNINYEQKHEMNKQSDEVLKMWWIKKGGSLGSTEKWEIGNALKTWTKWIWQLTKVKEIVKNSEITWMNLAGVTENSKYWIWQFSSWLSWMTANSVLETDNNAQIWRNMINWWNNEAKDEEKTIENLFKIKWSVQAYADEFGLWTVTDRETLRTKDMLTKESN